MRARWPRETPFTLNGEVDKAAHPILTKLGLGGKKPDLLVHGPGDMSNNHAIIEVKARFAKDTVTKDLETLSSFLSAAKYERGIYLFYGNHNPADLCDRVSDLHRSLESPQPIELWLHQAVGRPASQCCTLAV